jgi:predicted nucleic acid-binding protein
MSPAFLKLEAVPAGAAIFVDANIFIYHFLGVSRECEAFLERCAAGEVKAVTGTHIVAEVLHRLMIAEARVKSAGKTKGHAVRAKEGGKGGWVRYLESRPDEVRRLTDHHAAAAVIEQIVGTILPLTMDVLRASQWARNRDGLMINDSLTAAMIRTESLVHIATNDGAFLRIDGVSVYRPTDI